MAEKQFALAANMVFKEEPILVGPMSDLFGAPKREVKFDFLKASLNFGGSPDVPTDFNLNVGPSNIPGFGFNVGYTWAPSNSDEAEQLKQDPLGLRHQGLFGSVFDKRFGHRKANEK